MKKGNTLEEILATIIFLSLLFGYLPYFISLNMPQKDIKHDTNRWALVVDREGSRLAIETTNNSIWERIVTYYQEHKDSSSPISIGGRNGD